MLQGAKTAAVNVSLLKRHCHELRNFSIIINSIKAREIIQFTNWSQFKLGRRMQISVELICSPLPLLSQNM